MFERDSEWYRFRRILVEGTHTPEQISHYTNIPVETVNSYNDQLRGRAMLELAGTTVPETLIPYVVGFRYQSNNRWMETLAESRARQDYDDGKVEVCQGKYKVGSKMSWVMFAIPRRIVDKKRPLYFTAPTVQ